MAGELEQNYRASGFHGQVGFGASTLIAGQAPSSGE